MVNKSEFMDAWQVEDGDQVCFNGELLESVQVTDLQESILITGYSETEGDIVTLTLNPWDQVQTWYI